MEIKKRCQWCGERYITQKLTTLYCSKTCWDKAYRHKQKLKSQAWMQDELQSTLPVIEELAHKEYLNPGECAKPYVAECFNIEDEEILDTLLSRSDKLSHFIEIYQYKLAG